MSQEIDANVANIPIWLPANGHDIYNYTARYGIADFQIQTVLTFDGRLDPDKLLKSIRLSVDAEPILGCRFVEGTHASHWKRLDNIDEIPFCSIEETDTPGEAVQRFLESPLDMDHDPMVKLKLIRYGQYDILCVKNNHACCDAGGAKDYLQLLSQIYTCIDNNMDFIPKPGTRGRKDQDRLFAGLGIVDPESAWSRELEALLPTWTFPWHPGLPGSNRVATCRFSSEQFNQMSGYAKACGATVNDLILTAFYRALFEMLGTEYFNPMEILVTVDLRRYLPDHKTEAIRNFSGSVSVRIPRGLYEPFWGTLLRVMYVMNELKKGTPGLQSAVGLERLERLGFKATLDYFNNSMGWALVNGRSSPVLSNFGFIGKPVIKFGENLVKDAYMVPPTLRSPGFMLGVSTYNNALTLTVSYYEATVRREDVDRFLQRVHAELIEGCKLY